jgi:hypothetical protein
VGPETAPNALLAIRLPETSFNGLPAYAIRNAGNLRGKIVNLFDKSSRYISKEKSAI